MTKKKRKSRDESKASNKKQKKHDKREKRRGPRLPNFLRKELDRVNPNSAVNSDQEIDSDEANDVYEYEEDLPQEDSKMNHRFDLVDNYEYQLPKKFKDENVFSDDDDDNGEDGGNKIRGDLEQPGDDKEDDGRHVRMLQGITGMPSEAFEGRKKENNVVIAEAYPESEYNPSRDVLDGDGQITIQDLVERLHGKSGYSKIKKRTHKMERESMSIHAPLSKADRQKLERGVAYEQSKKQITKWEPPVKRNREAPTVYFDKDIDLGFSTVGAIASEFEPRTEFEKKMASLVYDDKILEAHKEDGARLLELNKISVEDYKNHRDHIAKMRNLLFRHEMKAKRIKKIKSKTYHRILKKGRLKAANAEMQLDPEAAKEQAMKQEFKRAEERLTLKHKNKSKWAERIIRRGLNAQDEGTRAAIAEQLNLHTLLSRKQNSMKDTSSSSDDSSDEDDLDENSAGSDQDGASKLLAKAKEKTVKELEEDDEVPNSGVLTLPFMVRGLKKREEAAIEEAKLALQEYDSSLKQLNDTDGAENSREGMASGRRVFGVAKTEVRKEVPKSNNKIKSDNYYGKSDSEDDLEAKENIDVESGGRKSDLQKNVNIKSALLNEDPEVSQDSVFKSFDDIVKEPGPKTTYDVAIFASNTWKKIKSGNEVDGNTKKSPKVVELVQNNQNLGEAGEESDTDSEGQMVDGILSSGPKASYELPSQAELIRHAFAGDDVEEDFEKDKQKILNEENPEPEKPVLIPGWGEWTHVQQKKGVPSWMLEEHENAKRKREEVLKKRKDAHLKHVIVSEKLDKKAEKLHTKTLPFPFTSKEVFEQSIRMPIGPEFNPATAAGALTRPDVVKKPGVIIKPIKFEEVNPHAKAEEHKQSGKKKKMNKARTVVVKS